MKYMNQFTSIEACVEYTMSFKKLCLESALQSREREEAVCESVVRRIIRFTALQCLTRMSARDGARGADRDSQRGVTARSGSPRGWHGAPAAAEPLGGRGI